MIDRISIRIARLLSAKNIDLDIPKYKLVILTSLSSYEKSNLGFDTLHCIN
jgi:excinuclease UvrABC ATPase subunit